MKLFYLPIIVPGDICSYSSSVRNNPKNVEVDVRSVVVDEALVFIIVDISFHFLKRTV